MCVSKFVFWPQRWLSVVFISLFWKCFLWAKTNIESKIVVKSICLSQELWRKKGFRTNKIEKFLHVCTHPYFSVVKKFQTHSNFCWVEDWTDLIKTLLMVGKSILACFVIVVFILSPYHAVWNQISIALSNLANFIQTRQNSVVAGLDRHFADFGWFL